MGYVDAINEGLQHPYAKREDALGSGDTERQGIKGTQDWFATKTQHHGTELAPSQLVKVVGAKLCTGGYTVATRKQTRKKANP
jgi:hypothetical protein